MASLAFNKEGTRLLVVIDDRRPAIWLGRISRSLGQMIKRHVEAIVIARRYGVALEPATAAWLSGIDDELYNRIARTGLLVERKRSTMAAFIERHLQSRAYAKPATLLAGQQARRHLVEYFGNERLIDSITDHDAASWAQWMTSERKKKLSRSTVGRKVRHAKYFFQCAVKDGYIVENPFDRVKSFQQVNSDRLAFVSRETIGKVIDVCPSAQWRLIIVLARYGGLRCPSEVGALKWGDVNWEQNKIWITSPKTEHHEGKAGRWIPLFPELRPHLEQAFADAPDGSIQVVDGMQGVKNLRTQMLRLINRAGLDPWPRLFQNLRASRQTELASEYPLFCAAAWIGNSAIVAVKHYLQVRDEDFARAAGNLQPDQSRPGQPAPVAS